ncbi:S8 family peptidase [Mucilaginibacter sp. AK015]|uniref:S8 family peptidase n=1 Tax=Mucilaginibacter sp. AK015 TaxID=2723072 RepID=UPI001607035A|nr:S8 family peptidase [Mucilaginibacter sp. AK015]MBB5396676.1 subtilisin family serine protease [Mucilaginibacter sp. AK015]
MNINNRYLKGIALGTLCLFFSVFAVAQKPNWQNLDLQKDSVFGISTEKTYQELLLGKKPKAVIVAVIDAGTDTSHEDLKAILWRNPKERRDGKDNDRNGYVDDINGWSFIGSAIGNVLYDNLELTRQVAARARHFNGLDLGKLSGTDKAVYQAWLRDKLMLDSLRTLAHAPVDNIHNFMRVFDVILRKLNTAKPSLQQLEKYKPDNDTQTQVLAVMVNASKTDPDMVKHIRERAERDLEHAEGQLAHDYNLDFDPRYIVGDHYENPTERSYGTPVVYVPEATHGTHVAGIIGAVRDNGIGINGVADYVQLMIVRVVPIGDERDKDVANGIRYAVDNGAKVINMSFGKGLSPYKSVVDDAVKYAMAHDVLIIHAAGNGNEDLDHTPNFPNAVYADGSGTAQAWLEVGASGIYADRQLKAPFSNYGKNTVDVFAPGVQILSAVPGSKYERFDGTSMAAPVVSGLAALIREYYPKLNAVQVKEIICKTVVPFPHHVFVTKGGQQVPIQFAELSKYGGVVNAYEALKLAEKYASK